MKKVLVISIVSICFFLTACKLPGTNPLPSDIQHGEVITVPFEEVFPGKPINK